MAQNQPQNIQPSRNFRVNVKARKVARIVGNLYNKADYFEAVMCEELRAMPLSKKEKLLADIDQVIHNG